MHLILPQTLTVDLPAHCWPMLTIQTASRTLAKCLLVLFFVEEKNNNNPGLGGTLLGGTWHLARWHLAPSWVAPGTCTEDWTRCRCRWLTILRIFCFTIVLFHFCYSCGWNLVANIWPRLTEDRAGKWSCIKHESTFLNIWSAVSRLGQIFGRNCNCNSEPANVSSVFTTAIHSYHCVVERRSLDTMTTDTVLTPWHSLDTMTHDTVLALWHMTQSWHHDTWNAHLL